MNRVMWFDIPFSDVNKGAEFYSKLFGWDVLPIDEKDGNDDLSFRVVGL
jgi:predicted enzyme related to lactoylglutathione lyase